MAELSIIYNRVADRRNQNLDFVGKERRKIILDAERRKEQEARMKYFLKDAQNIKGIKRLA